MLLYYYYMTGKGHIPPQSWTHPLRKLDRLCFSTSPPVDLDELATMSSTVNRLEVTYDPINESNTFTSGDCVSGRVTLDVAKDCEIQSLSIKFKGKARVLWTERHGQTTVVYHSKDKYFDYTHYFIRDDNIKGKWVIKKQNEN